jgi:hypothetical protein
METLFAKRTESYRWDTKLDLYAYFESKYNISQSVVDNEIERVKKLFRPRKGCLIKTQELWEKVGTSIERILGVPDSADAVRRTQAVVDALVFDKYDVDGPIS